MIELRCSKHQHLQFDPDQMRVVVKCRWCSAERHRAVYHEWPLAEIIDRHNKGEVVGVCTPTDPAWVHWVVKSAA